MVTRAWTIRLALGTSVSVLLVSMGMMSAVLAAPAPQRGWEIVDVGGEARELFAPKSGALFVTRISHSGSDARVGLSRSDDGGVSWREVPLPPPPVSGPQAWYQNVAVDPVDHTTLYASGQEGLYKSTDDAATWVPLPPPDPRLPTKNWDIVVSPADHALVFALKRDNQTGPLQVRRSQDGGQTWDEPFVWQLGGGSCVWQTSLFAPHPTDPNVVFVSASCRSSRGTPRIERSDDRGATWRDVFRGTPVSPSGGSGSPLGFAGGSAGAPSRVYAGVDKTLGDDSPLFLKSDDGLTFSTTNLGAGGMSLRGISVDPMQADSVFVALDGPGGGQIKGSSDGGAAWAPVGDGTLRNIHSLVAGIDGKMLFVATDDGVGRLNLH